MSDKNKCTYCGVEINYEGICEVCYCKGNDAYEQPKNQKLTCLLCGRDKFTHKSSHYCIGGYRKKRIKWGLKTKLGVWKQKPKQMSEFKNDLTVVLFTIGFTY